MNLLSQLKPNKGAVQKRKRVGRGDGSGSGGTSGRGHKGQKARSGAPMRRGFEGGQTPLQIRLPKFGFKNTMFRKHYDVITLDQLNNISGEANPETLKAAGIVSGKLPVKVLGNGELKSAVNVSAHKISKGAKTAIEKAGGKADVIVPKKYPGKMKPRKKQPSAE